ncbi:MAG: hypothetical protein P1P89_11090 [Desulfobacterales bacterium]|nr:hypothetical protein [Desulfobacterales bacterium]
MTALSLTKKTVVFDNDQSQCLALCNLLEGRDYQTVPVYLLSDLNSLLQKKSCLVVIIDLDTVSLDNRTIRDLTKKYPEVYFLCMSSERFHPELKEAICYHIYACINKPVDMDELIYWLRSIYEDEAEVHVPKEV